MTSSHETYMREALAQGALALPECHPNPPVGCVLVRDGEIIARGHTQPPYHPHAEAMALSQVSGPLHDVTAYVTLEPCSFVGRTPSCARTMIERGIGAVHVAILDPHPRNRGAGIAMLREAGVPVTLGTCAEEAERALGPHLWSDA